MTNNYANILTVNSRSTLTYVHAPYCPTHPYIKTMQDKDQDSHSHLQDIVIGKHIPVDHLDLYVRDGVLEQQW